MYCSVLYCVLSRVYKNTANQRPGLLLHILRYATGIMQRIMFHSTFPSLLARNSLLGPSEDFSKTSSETFQLLRTVTNISNHVRKYSMIFENFWRFPNIIKKIIIKTSQKHFWTVCEVFRNLPKIFWFSKYLKSSEKHFWTVCEVFRKFTNISEHFQRFPTIFRTF